MKRVLLGIAFIIMTVGSACGVRSGEPAEAAAVPATATVSLQPAAATDTPAPAADQQDNNPEDALLWEGPALFAEDQTECHRLRITQDNKVFIGRCDGEQTEVEFAAGGEGGWADMVARFAPFQSDTPDEHVIFNGYGQIAGPAWERAISTWARFTYAELASGHIGAANRTVLAWNLGEQPDQPGQCRMLIVLAHGYATASLTPCDGGQMQVLASGWVDPAKWEQFDTWLYGRAPFYQDNSYLDGRGTTDMNTEEAAALADWAEEVYATLTKTSSTPAGPALFVMIADNGKYGFVDPTGQMIVPPQYDNADRFIEGRAMIQRGDKWGFLDETGQEIVPPQYDSVNPYTEGLAAVLQDGHWGAIDRSGQMVIEPTLEAPPLFRGELAHLVTFGKFGLIDAGGQVVAEPVYTWLDDFYQN